MWFWRGTFWPDTPEKGIGFTKNCSNLLGNIADLFLNGGSVNDEDDTSSDCLVLVKESGPYSLMTRDVNQAKETLGNTNKKNKLQEIISISKNKMLFKTKH